MQDMLVCMRAAYKKEGIEAKPEKEHIGPALMDCLKNITPEAGPEVLERVAVNFRAVYDKSTYPNTTVYPGIRELLMNLEARKIPAYIVTNKRLAPTLRILKQKGLEGFKFVISPDLEKGKTLRKPEMIALLLKKEKLKPETAVYIGDSVPDVRSAKANNMKTIAVTYGYTEENELKLACPDWLVKDVESMSKLLLG